MAKNTTPKMVPPRPPGHTDSPSPSRDPRPTPDEAAQGQRRSVYTRRAQPSTTRRTKTKLIDRAGRSVRGPTEERLTGFCQ